MSNQDAGGSIVPASWVLPNLEARPYPKPTVPEVLPLVRALYARHSAGCCLHIVLDDENVNDAHVDFCIEWAATKGHDECLQLARVLRRMSKAQRRRLGAEGAASS